MPEVEAVTARGMIVAVCAGIMVTAASTSEARASQWRGCEDGLDWLQGCGIRGR